MQYNSDRLFRQTSKSKIKNLSKLKPLIIVENRNFLNKSSSYYVVFTLSITEVVCFSFEQLLTN